MSRVIGIILAGGVGARMGELGAALPKCLLPVGRQTLLQRLVGHCIAAGVDEILLSVSARHGPVVEAFVSQLDLPLPVRTVVEAKPLGTAAALASFAPHSRDARTLLVLGDEYFACEGPFAGLREQLASLPPKAMVVGTISRSTVAQLACQVTSDPAGRILRILDKPSPEEIEGATRWACYAAFGPGALDAAAEAVRAGRLRSGHIGDALDAIRAAGGPSWALDTACFELNVNGRNEALLVNLLESRAEWRKAGSDSLAFDSAIGALAIRLGIPPGSLP